MKTPNKFTASEHFCYNVLANDTKTKDGFWVPARPVSNPLSLKERLKLAWDVFSGKADALYWLNGQ